MTITTDGRVRRQVEKVGTNSESGTCELCGDDVGASEGVERRPGVVAHVSINGACVGLDGSRVGWNGNGYGPDPNWISETHYDRSGR